MAYNKCDECVNYSDRNGCPLREWECVGSDELCPKCGEEMGTIWKDERGEYRIPPRGRMGNLSFREDHEVGAYCPVCDKK